MTGKKAARRKMREERARQREEQARLAAWEAHRQREEQAAEAQARHRAALRERGVLLLEEARCGDLSALVTLFDITAGLGRLR